MKLLDLLHRWGGGVLGLILAVLGLSGAILVYKEEWIGLPHAGDARVSDPAQLGQLADRLLSGANGGESIVFASDRFGLVQVREGTGGLYASQTGETVARWSSLWERPELWLFDLHHHLFTGDAGEIVIGVAGIAAMVFVVTGTILWWRTRRTFRFRLWPARMTGPAIRMQHRDLGIMAAPLLFFVALTGTMMIFRPVAGAVLAPLSAPRREGRGACLSAAADGGRPGPRNPWGTVGRELLVFRPTAEKAGLSAFDYSNTRQSRRAFNFGSSAGGIGVDASGIRTQSFSEHCRPSRIVTSLGQIRPDQSAPLGFL